MNTESIIKQFTDIQISIRRSKLPFEVNMYDNPEIKKVVAYECLKSIAALNNIIEQVFPGESLEEVAKQLEKVDKTIDLFDGKIVKRY